MRSFLLSLDNVDFAEARHDELLLEILQASLNTFAGQVELVVGDDTLALLLKRVSATLVDQMDRAEKANDARRFSPCTTSAGKCFRTICGFPLPPSRSKPPVCWGPRTARKSNF